MDLAALQRITVGELLERFTAFVPGPMIGAEVVQLAASERMQGDVVG